MSERQYLPFDLEQFRRANVPICAIVKLATQPPGVLQQVTLRPDKVSRAGLIRLGETPGDEALCWIAPEHIGVVEILGTSQPANKEGTRWNVFPIAEAA